MALGSGTGEATAEVPPAAAFAYLADPRNAPQWFAGATFAEEPEGQPREGMAWSFRQTRSARVVPVHMSVYEPPSRFVWRTQLGWPRTNLVWEMRCDPVGKKGARTRLAFTIRIEPGPLGWPALLAAAPFSRGDVARRAERAVDRAREALLQQATPGEEHPRSTPKGTQRPGKRQQRPEKQ
jgi:uncharacterized protein YndB with AHSA1/START domain